MQVPKRLRHDACHLLLLLVLLTGCAPSLTKQGQHFLDTGQFDTGARHFKVKVSETPSNSWARYFYGRLLLAQGKVTPAVEQLQAAVDLEHDVADHHFWLGVALGESGRQDRERAEYKQALLLDPEHVGTLTALGHAQFRAGRLESALELYHSVLELQPEHPAALYTRALILQLQKRSKTEQQKAWRAYLKHYQEGPLPRKAAEHLNALGDFGYRTFFMGKRAAVVRSVSFNEGTDRIRDESYETLWRFGRFLTKHPVMVLHVVAFKEGNTELARARALEVEQALLDRFPGLSAKRMRLSWFAVTEEVKAGSETFALGDSMVLFVVEEDRI